MSTRDFHNLLLKTTFCCMACDGDIDKREIEFLRSIFKDSSYFSIVQFEDAINDLVKELNNSGKKFFTNYFDLLKTSSLTEQDELLLIDFAIKTIYADEVVEYSEVKFFKVIRSKLKVDNEKILSSFPEIEQFLEEDIITETYTERILNQYLDIARFPQFDLILPMNKPSGN